MRRVEENSAVVDNNVVIEKLREEHAALARRLDELNQNVYLTTAETAEISQLKRLKLQKKDAIRRLENS